jgi:hypothetical protein
MRSAGAPISCSALRYHVVMVTSSSTLVSDPLGRALDHLAGGARQQAHEAVPPDTPTLAVWRYAARRAPEAWTR